MFRKMLFPTDFSEGAIRAIKRFAEMNKIEVGECLILHVIDEGHLEDLMNGYSFLYKREDREMKDIEKMMREETENKLKERERRCKELIKSRTIRSMVRIGVPYEEIVKVAEEEDVSIILLPSHGKLGYSDELLGSTSIRVLRRTKKPTLVIKTHKG